MGGFFLYQYVILYLKNVAAKPNQVIGRQVTFISYCRDHNNKQLCGKTKPSCQPPVYLVVFQLQYLQIICKMETNTGLFN